MSRRGTCAKRLLYTSNVARLIGIGTQTFQSVCPAEFYSAEADTSRKNVPFPQQRSATPLVAQATSLCSEEGDFQKCRQDPKAGDERAPQCSGNFRFPTLATSMINGHFENAQACSGRFHLHLQIPTVGLFAPSSVWSVLPLSTTMTSRGVLVAITSRTTSAIGSSSLSAGMTAEIHTSKT